MTSLAFPFCSNGQDNLLSSFVLLINIEKDANHCSQIMQREKKSLKTFAL
jgi:hypothetical protein